MEIIIGFFAGIISGLGIGGGAILIPALSIFLALPQKEAQSINLIYFIPTGIIAAITHLKSGNIEKKVVPRLILFGLVSAVLGAMLAIKLEPGLLRKMFGWILVAIGLLELFKKEKKE